MNTIYQLTEEAFEILVAEAKGQKKKSLRGQLKFEKVVVASGYSFGIGYEYKGALTKMTLQCDRGHQYEVKPKDFHKGNRCPVCSGKCPIQAKKSFLKRVEDAGYKAVGAYKGVVTKVTLQCNKGHQYEATPNNFNAGQRCPACSGKRSIQAEKSFLKRVKDAGYEAIGAYRGNKVKVALQCDKGHQYVASPSDFKQGRRCPSCAKNGYQPSKAGHFYITGLSNKQGNTEVIKFGITNRPINTRIKEHEQEGSGLLHFHIDHLSFMDGQVALDLENDIKQVFKGRTSFMSQLDLASGYTETIKYTRESYVELMAIVDRYRVASFETSHKTHKLSVGTVI